MHAAALEKFVLSRLETRVGDLSPVLRGVLKLNRLHNALPAALRDIGVTVAPDTRIQTLDPYHWEIVSGTDRFLVRDRGDRLEVAREIHPLTELLLRKTWSTLRTIPLKTRKWAFLKRAMISKRWENHRGPLRVNLGAGPWHVPGWRVLDHEGPWYRYPRHFVDFECDLTTASRLPFNDRSVDLFYSEHVLEHFPQSVCARILREMARCLASGRGARIVVPDAELVCERFLAKDRAFFAHWMQTHNASMTEAFLILVGQPRDLLDAEDVERRFRMLPRVEFLDGVCDGLLYNPEHAGEHINWFDFEKLSGMLRAAGFRKVLRSVPGGSVFPEMQDRRFDTRPHYSLHVDALI